MSASESGRLPMPASPRMYPPSALVELQNRGSRADAPPEITRPRPKLAKATQQPPSARTKVEPKREAKAKATPGASTGPRVLKLQKRSKGWALLVDDLDEPAWIVSTKKAGLGWAEDAARFHACTLEIYKTDGSLQREKNYAA